jgi:uncharacterized protein (TIGR00369 family)
MTGDGRGGAAGVPGGRVPAGGRDFAIEALDRDGMTVRLRVADRHLRPGGTVSGPSIFALADVAIYLAILARIGPVALAVTTNCSIDFMRKPAAGADLIAQARLLKLGRVLAVGDVLIRPRASRRRSPGPPDLFDPAEPGSAKAASVHLGV